MRLRLDQLGPTRNRVQETSDQGYVKSGKKFLSKKTR